MLMVVSTGLIAVSWLSPQGSWLSHRCLLEAHCCLIAVSVRLIAVSSLSPEGSSLSLRGSSLSHCCVLEAHCCLIAFSMRLIAVFVRPIAVSALSHHRFREAHHCLIVVSLRLTGEFNMLNAESSLLIGQLKITTRDSHLKIHNADHRGKLISEFIVLVSESDFFTAELSDSAMIRFSLVLSIDTSTLKNTVKYS